MLREPTFQEQERLAKGFAEIASSFDLPLKACAEKHDFSSYGIRSASCIDPGIFRRLCAAILKNRTGCWTARILRMLPQH
ncbi:MAG: DUF1848 family protein [Clostridia bacterium]